MRRALAAVLGLLLLASAAPAAETVHQVARGDTLGAIARRYGVTVGALVNANDLPGQNAKLKIGQRLVVPAAGAPAPPGTAKRKGAIPPRAARNLREARGPVNLQLAVPDFVDGAPIFLWPIDGPITSPFGLRRRGWHRGMDIRAALGDPVFAVAEGVVVASGVEPRYGRVVKIEHDDGFMTVYAHNDSNLVEVGDVVPAGHKIATIGHTGRATGDHLHFEVRRDGRVYNPLYMLPLPARVLHVEETDSEEEDE